MPERIEPVSTESGSGLADAPRRSRRQGATSTKKKKKSKAKGYNIIAGDALLEGTIRSFSDEVWKKVPEQLERVVS